ncbi:LysR family transcriptional regulator [Vibrio superstes]|uniref:LysR family transcriptional regulator n=1 Tax=Vibrio superstes TaxID=198815 RepID=UPI0016499839|nr:LysR family transcriptional regulator [Vibrio superstes]
MNQIEAFVHTVETGSFKDAGIRLDKRRQVVARSVASLEETCNVSLFTRHTRHVEITEEGKKLYRTAKRVLLDARNFENQLASFNRQLPNSFSVAIDSSLACPEIANCYLAVLEEIPSIDLKISMGGTKQVIDWVSEGTVEMALLFSPLLNLDNLQNITVLDFPVVDVGPPNLVNFGEIKEQDTLSDMTQIVPQSVLDFGYQQGYIDSDKNIFVNDLQESVNMMLAGVGWARLPEFIARPHIEAGRLNAFSRLGGSSGNWYAEVIYANDEMLTLAGDIFLEHALRLREKLYKRNGVRS